jgi:hypothetical protein
VSSPQYFCHSSNVFLAHTSMCLLVLRLLLVHIICFKKARLQKYLIRSKFIVDNKIALSTTTRELRQSAQSHLEEKLLFAKNDCKQYFLVAKLIANDIFSFSVLKAIN